MKLGNLLLSTQTMLQKKKNNKEQIQKEQMWYHDLMVITTVQLHSTKPKLSFCAGSNSACGVSEIHDGDDL